MADLDAEKAALEMQNYRTAISSAAQTALRDIIGRNGAHRPAARPYKDRVSAAGADRSPIRPPPARDEHALRGVEGKGAVESMGLGGLLGAAALRQQSLTPGGDDVN